MKKRQTDNKDRMERSRLRQKKRKRQLFFTWLCLFLFTAACIGTAAFFLLSPAHRDSAVTAQSTLPAEDTLTADATLPESEEEQESDFPAPKTKETEPEEQNTEEPFPEEAPVAVTSSDNALPTETDSDAGTVDEDADYLAALRSMAESEPRAQEILDNLSLYPEKLLMMLAENAETLDFVLDYPEKSACAPAATVGTLTPGEVPLLLQWDERWGYAPYGSETIVALSGCGPTCLSMVICALTGDNTVTPAVVAEYAAENGYLTSDLNTSWSLMTTGAAHFGITGKTLPLSEKAIADVLADGSPVICSMRPGIFTNSGHFIVLTGYDDGAFTVNDPASAVRSAQTYTFDEIRDQIKNLWYFTVPD